jgi:arginyl-tRNA synthetase
MTSFEGDTGAYLQYAHVRLCSIERKASAFMALPPQSSEVNVDLLSESKAREIIFLLATYPEVVRSALKTHEPSAIVSYCFRSA